MHWVILAADTGSGTPNVGDWIQLINLPLSLLTLYGFARGWFITGKEHQRVVDERNSERDERIAAQQALTDKALPALQENERTMGDLVKAVERLESRRRGS
jgi:hypothetical protein